MMAWINVDEKLPEPHEDVLARYENGDLFNGRICYGMHRPFWCDNSRDDPGDTIARRRVTHWIVIPPLSITDDGETIRKIVRAIA